MAKPRSEERRAAILAAAAVVIAAQGLGAPTASIAREAGVSNGSLFVYFDTKATLVNELYVALKTEMAGAATDGLPLGRDARDQVRHLWDRWLAWAVSAPEKWRALAQLEVSDDVTADSRRVASTALSGIADLLERSRADGPMRAASLGFVVALMSAIADTTVNAMIAEPDQAGAHARIAFDAVWRMLA